VSNTAGDVVKGNAAGLYSEAGAGRIVQENTENDVSIDASNDSSFSMPTGACYPSPETMMMTFSHAADTQDTDNDDTISYRTSSTSVFPYDNVASALGQGAGGFHHAYDNNTTVTDESFNWSDTTTPQTPLQPTSLWFNNQNSAAAQTGGTDMTPMRSLVDTGAEFAPRRKLDFEAINADSSEFESDMRRTKSC
jgi:hypothetical protein